MPFKANSDRRHRFPKQRHRFTNWAEYDAGLRSRSSLTIWLSEQAVEGWRADARTGQGGQLRYSALAIATALTLHCVSPDATPDRRAYRLQPAAARPRSCRA
jgi:hypothetical protein